MMMITKKKIRRFVNEALDLGTITLLLIGTIVTAFVIDWCLGVTRDRSHEHVRERLHTPLYNNQ